jgi:zinc transporter ZupT
MDGSCIYRNNFFSDWLYLVIIYRTFALSFAAGAILVMLAESMIPVAYEEGGATRIGIAVMVGFSLAFILGNI